MIIVSNTSPIIAFSKIQKLDILEKLFVEISIPEKVFEECTHYKYKEQFEINQNLFRVEKVESVDSLLLNEVDQGEAEAIALAMQKKADWLILDDRKGRRIAKHFYQLNIIGTAGILLKAKRAGFVNTVSDIFKELKEINYYIADSIVHEICKLVGE